MPVIERGMAPHKEKVWIHMTAKEDIMKLKWFHKNQQRLIADAERTLARKGLSPEILEEVEKLRQQRYRNMERHGKKKGVDLDFPDIDPHCIMNVMKHVEPEVTHLLFSNLEKLGRRNYLKARYKVLPIDRYFFPETSNFTYGWNLMATTKEPGHEENFGRRQIIKNSFYRRNGSLRNDPEHHRDPQADSPTVCRC